jgi:hypothetical protein
MRYWIVLKAKRAFRQMLRVHIKRTAYCAGNGALAGPGDP